MTQVKPALNLSYQPGIHLHYQVIYCCSRKKKVIILELYLGNIYFFGGIL